MALTPADARRPKNEKGAIQAVNPEAFVQDPHYDGYGAVIVRLEAIDADDLTELLTQGRQEQLTLLAAKPRSRARKAP